MDEQAGIEADEADAREAAWIASARAGDAGAFNLLLRAYAQRIFGYLYRMLRDAQEAEDMTQETFVKAYQNMHHYDGVRPFRSWLYAIATNTGRNALRSRRRRGHSAPLEDAADVAAPAVAEAGLQRIETRRHIDQALRRLSPQAAALINLHYREQMSIREAAEVLGISEGAAKVALHRARRQLREWLVEERHEL